MTAEERTAKLKEWDKTLDEDTRAGVGLIIQGFDKWLDNVEKNEYDEETARMLMLIAANRYNVGETSGLASMFAMFAEGFLHGLTAAENFT